MKNAQPNSTLQPRPGQGLDPMSALGVPAVAWDRREPGWDGEAFNRWEAGIPRLNPKLSWATLVCICGIGFAQSVIAQGTLGNGTFQDLDFESAVVVPVAGTENQIQAAAAFPGWTVTIAGTSQTTVSYPFFFQDQLDQPGVALVSASAGALAGNYCLAFQTFPMAGGPVPAISQTAMVPNGARSLDFLSSTIAPLQGTLSINGTAVPYSQLSGGSQGLATFGADISGYAGKVVTLTISAIPSGTWFSLDNLSFSSVPVPEVSSGVLFGVGCLLAIGMRGRRSGIRHGTGKEVKE